MSDIVIREAEKTDRAQIRDVHLQAFPEEESSLTAALADSLLNEDSSASVLTLVAEVDGEVVGHIAFSPVYAAGQQTCLGYILAPLAVRPICHDMGVGSKLVETGVSQLSGKGVDLFFVYGDPAYYGRFGFEAQAASGFLPPYALKYPFGWLATRSSPLTRADQPVRLSCVASLHNPALW